MTNSRKKLGIDIGGVIIGRGNDGDDTSFFGPNYLMTGAVPHAFESIKTLRGAGLDVYLVSKCGLSVEQKTRDWLSHHNFYDITGVPESQVRFCRNRADKAIICDEIGITHFVDDRLEVLSYLENVGGQYLFNPDDKEVRRFAQALPRVVRVASWLELVPIILNQSGAAPQATSCVER